MNTNEYEQAPIDNYECFGCGPKNVQGLRLLFVPAADGDGVEFVTRLAARFQGWEGFAHGGIVCTLLDEAMAHAGLYAGRSCVTAGMKVRFRHPTPLAVPLYIRGRILERRSRLLRMGAEIRDEDDVVLATAEGDFIDRGEKDPSTLAAQIVKEAEL